MCRVLGELVQPCTAIWHHAIPYRHPRSVVSTSNQSAVAVTSMPNTAMPQRVQQVHDVDGLRQRLIEPDITTVSSSSTFCHILLSINIRFLLEQYLSETRFLKPASARIPAPHSRRSSVTRPERRAQPPPHRRDTRKWSDDYWTRIRTSRLSVSVLPHAVAFVSLAELMRPDYTLVLFLSTTRINALLSLFLTSVLLDNNHDSMTIFSNTQ